MDQNSSVLVYSLPNGGAVAMVWGVSVYFIGRWHRWFHENK
jgi:hypothetical protein